MICHKFRSKLTALVGVEYQRSRLTKCLIQSRLTEYPQYRGMGNVF